jgi:hypothetical protein
MIFKSEKEFETHIRELVIKYMLPKDKNLVLFKNKKAVDILICRNGKRAALYFIEIKYHKRSHGRLSTGHSKGVGFQPEILSKLPTYFESNMRWVLGAEDIDGYYFLKTSQLSEYLAGGKIGVKHNNIQAKVFRHESTFNRAELIQSLKDWIL